MHAKPRLLLLLLLLLPQLLLARGLQTAVHGIVGHQTRR